MSLVTFSGPELFSYRLALSFLSGRPVKITSIRSNDTNPGLKGRKNAMYASVPLELMLDCGSADYEVSLLRLLEKVTNGTVIEISYTGKLPWYLCLRSVHF